MTALDATVAILKSKGIKYRLEKSPRTGQLSAWVENDVVSVVYAGTTVDTTALVSKINADLEANYITGYCDPYVGFVGNVASNTYYPKVFVETTVTADGKLAVYDNRGLFVDPITLGALIIVAIGAIIAGMGAYLLVWTYQNTFHYWNPETGTIDAIAGAEAYVSHQNAMWWYTCPKDGTGIGLKSQYPTLAEYQASPNYAAEKAYLEEHCSTAQDIISGKLVKWIDMLIYAVIALGGVYVAIKVLPPLLSRKKE